MKVLKEPHSVEQFLIGSKLGDACFVKKSDHHNTYIAFKHCKEQYEYLNWKYDVMRKAGYVNDEAKGIVQENIKPGSCFKNSQPQYRFATISSEKLNRYRDMTDAEIIERFGEEAFAVWLLDDGNIHNRTTKIACGSKSKELAVGLAEKINKAFGIEAFYYEHPTKPVKNYIRIPPRCYQKVKSIVLAYVPQNLDVVMDKFDVEPTKNLAIRVKYHVEQPELCFVEGKSDWVDLRAAETVEMNAGDYRIISLGVSMELPEGYEAHVAPRSSTFKKWGILLVNGIGIIDNSYSGDTDIWGFPALAMRDTAIHKGDRICQFRIVKKQPELEFEVVESLGNKSRGGFGSTGTK